MNTTSNNSLGGYHASNRGHALAMIARTVWFIALVIIAILAVRFSFILFGANPANGFVNFIYDISYPFAHPFFGIFGYSVHYGLKRFEPASLVAMGVYALGAYLIVRLLSIPQD